MIQHRKYNLRICIIVSLCIVTIRSFADLNYRIRFTSSGVSSTFDSIIVVNSRTTERVIVFSGNDLLLSDSPTSIELISNKTEDIRITNDPNIGEFSVSFYANNAGLTSINAYASNGKLMTNYKGFLPQGNHLFKMSLPKGFYVIKVCGTKYQYSSKFINQFQSYGNSSFIYVGKNQVKSDFHKIKSIENQTLNYNSGDTLIFKGYWQAYKTFIKDVPVDSKTLNFYFAPKVFETTNKIPSSFGVNSHNPKESIEVLQKMYDAGIRFIRYDLPWQNIEKLNGVYDFSEFDIAYLRAEQVGIKLLLIFDYTNPYYDNNYSPYTELGRRAFTNYVKAAVEHFQGKGIIWEIYNEPTGFWIFSDGSKPDFQNITSVLKCETQYALLANMVSSSIKSEFPNEVVIGPGMAWCDGMVSPGFNNSLTFLQNWYKTGACNNLDAISIHPYRQVAPEYAMLDYPFFRDDISNKTYNNSGKNPLIVCSEWGYSAGWVGIGGSTYTEREVWKSKNIARLLLTNIMNNIPLTILYDWMNDGSDQTNSEHQFGLVLPYDKSSSNPNITVLNGYNALKTLSTQLFGYSFLERLNIGTSGVLGDYILSFTNGIDIAYACWNAKGKANTVNIPVTAGKAITITNYDGTLVTKSIVGINGYSCQLTDAPQYITVDKN